MNTESVLAAMQKGDISMEGQFIYGSNITFLVICHYDNQRIQAVYKPMKGEHPLYDFPNKTLAGREVTAYLVSEALGWGFVPPTIYRMDGIPVGPGSLQYFIEHDPHYHYFKFKKTEKAQIPKVMAFDLLINNADRKGGHFLLDKHGKLWLIDHGLSFHVEDKLRTVAWDHAGLTIPTEILSDICGIIPELSPTKSLYQVIQKYLLVDEIEALRNRAVDLIEKGEFPLPPEERRAYPWPLV